MASNKVIEARLTFKRTALDEAQKAYIALLSGGVKSYTIGSRSLTKFDLAELETTIAKLENEIAELENMQNGGKPRRALGVVPRDW